MTERSYITVDRAESPRLIEVVGALSGGSDEVIIQDLHDTLNSNTLTAGDPDDSLDNMDDDFMIDSAGKEDLGGGVQVGITSTLNNAQVAFEGNYTPAQTGAATSADVSGLTLTDTSATFITNGVARGYWIINFTDQSVTEVLRVISETVLEHRILRAGINNDWSISDQYSVFEVIQKEIAGGNLVAVDDSDTFPLGDDISPVFPTFATQVITTRSASATIAGSRLAAFAGAVHIDTASGIAGTAFPIGTFTNPVNNVADAKAIADENNLKSYDLNGTIVLTENHEDWRISGHDGRDVVVLTPAASVNNCLFETVTLTGTQSGDITAIGCVLTMLSGALGGYSECAVRYGHARNRRHTDICTLFPGHSWRFCACYRYRVW
jgi:hypothetical protein